MKHVVTVAWEDQEGRCGFTEDWSVGTQERVAAEKETDCNAATDHSAWHGQL